MVWFEAILLNGNYFHDSRLNHSAIYAKNNIVGYKFKNALKPRKHFKVDTVQNINWCQNRDSNRHPKRKDYDPYPSALDHSVIYHLYKFVIVLPYTTTTI